MSYILSNYQLIWVDCCVTDGTDVLYNKFNVDSSSPPDNPPQRPNSDYNCQSDHDTLSGIMTTCLLRVRIFTEFSCSSSGFSELTLMFMIWLCHIIGLLSMMSPLVFKTDSQTRGNFKVF